jgi:hypothetical protein
VGRIASHLRAALDEEGEVARAARPTPTPEEAEVEGWLGGPKHAAASTPDTIAAIPMDLSVRTRLSQSAEPTVLQLLSRQQSRMRHVDKAASSPTASFHWRL